MKINSRFKMTRHMKKCGSNCKKMHIFQMAFKTHFIHFIF